MPWCPKCRRYQEEDDLCSNCWVELVDNLSRESRAARVPENEVLLISVSDENEANIIQKLLETHKIPSLRKYRDIGGYMKVYMGTSAFGIDIFVPESCMEASREILGTGNFTVDNTGIDNTDFDEILSVEPGQTQSSFDPEEKKNVARWLLLFILIPVAAGLIAALIGVFW